MSNIHCTELHPGSALLRSRTSNSGKEQGPSCKGDYESHLQVLGLWNSLEGGCISNRATINYALHGRKPKRSLENKAKDVVVMAKHDHVAAWAPSFVRVLTFLEELMQGWLPQQCFFRKSSMQQCSRVFPAVKWEREQTGMLWYPWSQYLCHFESWD